MALHRYSQFPGSFAGQARQVALRRFYQRQNLHGQVEQALARGGKGDRIGLPLEQAGPVLLFQRLDLMRKRRLRNVQLLGGARETA